MPQQYHLYCFLCKSDIWNVILIDCSLCLSISLSVCQRAAGFANMVPFLHVADPCYGLLQLVRTIAKWFQYVDSEKVRKSAQQVQYSMEKGWYSRAHDECLALVDDAIEADYVSCFVLDRIQFLDSFSLSFIRECLHGRKYRQAYGEVKYGLHRPELYDSLSSLSFNGDSDQSKGRIAFLCVHVPYYNTPDAQSLVDDITRSHRNLSVPIVEVGQATLEQFKELTSTMTMSTFSDRLLYTGSAAAGYCAGYFIERVAAISQIAPLRLKQGLPTLIAMTDELETTIPPGCLRKYRKVSVMEVGPHIAMRYGHVYDELPPIMQVFCKILAVVSQTEFYWAPRNRIWEVMNDLIAQGVDDDMMTALLDELKGMYVIRIWVVDGVEYIKFQSPGMADVSMDVCTSVQIENIGRAWISRLETDTASNFRIYLVLAWLHNTVDPCQMCPEHTSQCKRLWQEGYKSMLKTSKEEGWEMTRVNRWKEVIASEIVEAGRDVRNILGSDFSYNVEHITTVDADFVRLLMYRGPIGLGPLGNTLSIISVLLTKEIRFCVGHDDPAKEEEFRRHKQSACQRYVLEVEIIEELLAEYSLGTEIESLNAERTSIERLSTPACDKSGVYDLAKILVHVILPCFVEPRLERLRILADKLEGADMPPFVANVNCVAIKDAYRIMFEMFCGCNSQGGEVDCAQHALMVLATRGWEPRPTPEPMNHLKRQTVARLRNAVVQKLSEGQLHYSRHQQSAVDLKAFLITTALLFNAQDNGRYVVA